MKSHKFLVIKGYPTNCLGCNCVALINEQGDVIPHRRISSGQWTDHVKISEDCDEELLFKVLEG